MVLLIFLMLAIILFFLYHIYRALYNKPTYEEKLKDDIGRLIVNENDAWDHYAKHLDNLNELLNTNNIKES